jgi:hypothetical protein
MYINFKDAEIAKVGTAVGTGVVFTVDLRKTKRMCDEYAIQAVGTGSAPGAMSAVLECSNDGTNFTTLQAIAHTDDKTVFFVNNKLSQVFRVRVASLTLGGATNVKFYLIAS